MAVAVYDEAFARHEFALTREDRLLEVLQGDLKTIFDVGSNIGEWTRMARHFHPDAEIHSFEIVPETYRKQISNIIPNNKTFLNGFGLSNECGVLPMQHNTEFDAMSSCLLDLHVDAAVMVDGLVFTGDQYVASRNINYIDFLKIDVEGAEAYVFEGFEKTLNDEKIGIIQFEYGFANVLSRFFLIDAYKLLKSKGFYVGKMVEGQWHQRDYVLLDENFQAPNVVAVHKSKMDQYYNKIMSI